MTWVGVRVQYSVSESWSASGVWDVEYHLVVWMTKLDAEYTPQCRCIILHIHVVLYLGIELSVILHINHVVYILTLIIHLHHAWKHREHMQQRLGVGGGP